MNDFVLDSRLESDCHLLGELGDCLLLLMDNSKVPWLILVPKLDVTEFHELESDTQLQVMEHVTLLSDCLKQEFQVDKINVAAIGNIVRQLHIHIVGRKEGDYCWPGVVWGAEGAEPYSYQALASTLATVKHFLGPRLTTRSE